MAENGSHKYQRGLGVLLKYDVYDLHVSTGSKEMSSQWTQSVERWTSQPLRGAQLKALKVRDVDSSERATTY